MPDAPVTLLAGDALPESMRESWARSRSIRGDATFVEALGSAPELFEWYREFYERVFYGGRIDRPSKELMRLRLSMTHGCRYCQAHTANGANLDTEEIDALWTYETSECFTDAEKAALALAVEAASQEPLSESTSNRVKQHFDADEICKLVAILALLGFLNRWNTLMGTTLEASPLGFAATTLESSGWQPGQHDSANLKE